MQKRLADQQAQEESKTDISWSSQIPSCVLDQSRIKDQGSRIKDLGDDRRPNRRYTV